jgi:hypothetical protein
MTEERDPRADDPMDELRAELEAVAAPEQFAHRVRERISAGRVPGSRFRVPGSRSGVRLGAIAAAVVLLWLSGWQRAGGPVTHVAEAGDVRDAPAVPADGSRAGRIARNLEPGTRNPEPGTRNLEPPFEVITNQPEILRRLYAGMNEMAMVASLESIPVRAGEIVIAPVEVNPIVVKLMVEPPVEPGALPIIRRATADAAERSDK